jgi:hypothetical protein
MFSMCPLQTTSHLNRGHPGASLSLPASVAVLVENGDKVFTPRTSPSTDCTTETADLPAVSGDQPC